MGAMSACGVIVRKVDCGIKICVVELADSPRAIENSKLQWLADRIRTVFTTTCEAE